MTTTIKNDMTNSSRRNFIVGSAAVGTGLAIGFDLSFISAANAAMGSGLSSTSPLATPEIGVWVVVKPNDDVVVRIVRSEMGQGTITGLAQMVAEELQCDWKKVSYEYPSPGESLKRKQAWGSYSTGGSRGIRTSEQYVRQGGAVARVMLIQAAANTWGVPASECVALIASLPIRHLAVRLASVRFLLLLHNCQFQP